MDDTCFCGWLGGWLGVGMPSHPVDSFHPTDRRVTGDDMDTPTCDYCKASFTSVRALALHKAEGCPTIPDGAGASPDYREKRV